MVVSKQKTDRTDQSKLGKKKWLWWTCGMIVVALVIIVAHDVPTQATAEDHASGQRILAQAGYKNTEETKFDLETFDGEISAILAVQDAVLTVASKDVPIPFNTSREPGDLLVHRKGECYDRARAIEKILTSLGMETRHIAVYSTAETGSKLVSLVTPQVSSHAVSEVKTSRGWMLIDSNAHWIGLTEEGAPMSIEDIQTNYHDSIRWSLRNQNKMNPIFGKGFTYVIGLYSRHGRFFAPYSPIPDYNIRDLLTGLIS